MSQEGQLERKLKLRHVVVLGFAYMSPFGVFDTFGIASDITQGHVPLSYIVVTIAILLTALSYGKMVKIYPSAGSAFTYTTQTFGRHLGFLVGWAILLDYLFLVMINALLARIYISSGLPDVPEWIWVVALLVIITALNILGVKLAASVNTLMVLFQLLVVAIFIILITRFILTGESESFSLLPFNSDNVTNVLGGAALLALSFTGFDAITTLTEETVEPKKNIPKAAIIIALAGGAYLIFVTYFMQILFPDVSILNDIEGASPEIALHVGGVFFQSIFIAGAIVSVLSSGLAAQTSASRLLFTMGRDGVFPKKLFGYLHPRFSTPIFSIVVVAVISLTAIFLNLDVTAALINFGVFIAFSFVNLSVISYYLRNKKHLPANAWISYLILPTLGFIFLIYLGFNLDKISIILGSIWVIVGFIYLLYLTRLFKISPPGIDYNE